MLLENFVKKCRSIIGRVIKLMTSATWHCYFQQAFTCLLPRSQHTYIHTYNYSEKCNALQSLYSKWVGLRGKLREWDRKKVWLQLDLKVCIDRADVTSAGRLFHAFEAATGKTRLPIVQSRVSGIQTVLRSRTNAAELRQTVNMIWEVTQAFQ